MNNVKRSFLTSLISLVLCLTMFLGTTFAWFTDIVVSGGNIIQSGKLDAEMYWSDEYLASTDSGWTQVKDNKPIFTYDNWEPGYTEIKYIKVANAGNLNFKWKLSIEAEGKVTDLSDVIDVYYVNPVNGELTKQALAARTPDGKLTDVLANKTATEGDQLTPGGSVVLAIAFHMDELAGNEYQEKSLCDKGFSLKLLATQATGENDSFDDQYDKESEWPEIPSAGNNASADVPTDANGVVTTATTITGNGMSATVPAGTQLTKGTNKLTLSVNNVEDSKANVTLGDGEELRALDVHVSGVAEGNTTPIAVTLIEALPKGLNIGNYTLYHVEDGQTVPMTLPADGATPVHNNFTYDPVTGDVTLYMASFSEIGLIAEPAKWEGNRDYSWYTNAVAPVDGEAVTEYVIANADQLAAFSAIVGNMAEGIEQDSFSGKTVKLIADINLGDDEEHNKSNIIFYPIGYHSSDGKYEKTGVAVTTGFYNFCGTFDGNGHTVANFYQNTWEMKGDNNYYDATLQYYRDGMGLFGRVYGGTIKNLTVKNFSSDGEYTTTGTIAAYADGATFENIAIFNCNPRVYNIGNGGIVGCVGWYAKEANLKTTFTNITVDNSNKISALWGSYDVACGGIVGQYYPTSGQSSATYPVNAGMHFENCHVSAQMDVYNDVCANYQYYAYRYTGMLIGSVRENVTIDGHSYPKMDGITAEKCTVHFGTWNDYYYCEIIDNTTASYTHDYQMSRLTEIKAIDGTTITYLDGTTGKVPETGRANYVIVDYTKGHGTDNATCYHFKDGAVWTHDMGGAHNGENGEKFIDENGDGVADLKEDKQHIYLEFNNLVTGYGWGVTSKCVGQVAGVTILDRPQGNSIEKFEGKLNSSLENNKTYTLGEIFKYNYNGVELKPQALNVSITNPDENNPVSATIVYGGENWEDGTIIFTGEGKIQITIQDYYFCIPTTITVEVESHKHTYDNTCDNTCNTCGEEREITHTYTPAETAPSCTTGGYTTYTCECGHYYVSDEVPALGHKYNTVITAPSCTTDGYTTYTCTVCNYSYTGDDTTATGHTNSSAVKENEVASTCTTNGSYDSVIYCSKCEVELSREKVTVEATGHYYTSSETAPTCETAGYTTYICHCGHTYTDNEVAALGHIETKFTGDFLYRVGNQNDVELSSLFNVGRHTVKVSGAKVAGNASVTVNGTTLKFNGTGVVKVTLTNDCTCDECELELNLEVVDAYNATSATDATANNVVLLNNTSASDLTVSNGWAFYGNGFEIKFDGDGSYRSAAVSYGFVTLKNGGTLDNTRVVCKVFPKSYMFTSEMTAGTDGRYPYGYSAIIMSDNSTVSNCYVYGARNNILVSTGDALITNTVTECGSLSNIQVLSASDYTVTLDNVTTIQYQTTSPFDTSAKVLGFGVVVGLPNSSSNATIKLTGDFNQYNWVTNANTSVSNTYTKSAIEGALKVTKYQHTNAEGDTTVNTGIAYMNSLDKTIIDERTNTGVKYEGNAVSISGYNGYVYSIINKTGNPDATINRGQFTNCSITPNLSYNSKGDSDKLTTAFDSNTNRWVNTLTLDLDALGTYTFNFSDLIASKYGIALDYEVKDANGNMVNKSTTITLNQLYNAEYTLLITDNQVYNNKGELTGSIIKHEVVFAIHATKTSIEPPKFTGIGNGTAIRTYETSFDMSSFKNVENWRPAYKALEGVSVTYWSASQGKTVTVELSTLNTKGSISGNVWTYTCDDYTLTITGGQVHTSGSKISPIKVNNELYFWSADKAFTTDTTSRDIILTYVFTDKNASTTESMKKNVKYSELKQYVKSDFANGKLTEGTGSSGSSTGCFAEGSLVTLADGTQKPIEDITYEDQLLAWDFFTGTYVATVPSLIDRYELSEQNVINLQFADGTVVRVVIDHGFFDVEANKFVFINEENVASYVGHTFVKASENGTYENVELVGYEITVENIAYYSIQTAVYNNCIVEGVFTLCAPPEMIKYSDWFNYFEIGEGMKYDEEKMQADIEQYGLYTYEDFAEYVTYEQFMAFNGPYLKVLVGRGVVTYEQIIELISIYVNSEN